MNIGDVEAYARRAWTAMEALKQEHWATEFDRLGPDVTFQASQALWAHMRSVRPDWPSDDDRQSDLARHIEVKRAIDRAAGAFLARTRR